MGMMSLLVDLVLDVVNISKRKDSDFIGVNAGRELVMDRNGIVWE